MKNLHIDGPWFKDNHGRTVLLRGVNLGGSSKVPISPAPTDPTYLFTHHRQVSFINRPFPLDEAPEHFSRLRHWGLTFLRLIVTWEAIEHAGPGLYDYGYLTYLHELVRQANLYGINLFIDPHQDVWSRLCGGDGAPGWTLEAVGFDPPRFEVTGAAWYRHANPQTSHLQWFTNYTKLATATMFTLFFGGNDFAPKQIIDGKPVQEYLQNHYINALKQVALTLKDFPNVVGFGTMNEPSGGFIGIPNLAFNDRHTIRLGPTPTPYQAMVAGAGYPQNVELWDVGLMGMRPTGHTTCLNQPGLSAWQMGHRCIWREHGVWDEDRDGNPQLLKPHYFSRVERDGKTIRIDFGEDYLKPFINRYTKAIRTVQPKVMMFVETIPEESMPFWTTEDVPNIVNATHWYDGFTLFTALFFPFLHFDIYSKTVTIGPDRVQQLFNTKIARIKHWSNNRLGGVPTLIGECGTSFNMPFRLNYWLNWFGIQAWALDALYQAKEANLLSSTLWNYTPDNSNHWGDIWNGEDLSIFSRDQQSNPPDLNSGGRAINAVVRPYPIYTAGKPVSLKFDYQRHHFSYCYQPDPTLSLPTEIFVPSLHYPGDYQVTISTGYYEIDTLNQRLIHWPSETDDVQMINLTP